MLNNITDVKREIKELVKRNHLVTMVRVNIEEFGEGYNTYLDIVSQTEKEVDVVSNDFTMAEEETLSKAKARAERIKESIKKLGMDIQVEVEFNIYFYS
jgi:hypothetical protein